MNRQTLSELSEAEFDTLLDDHIDREVQGYGELPLDLFFDLLAERIEARADETLSLEIDVGAGSLVITPDREMGDVVVRGNEILIAGHRLIFQLAERAQAAP